MFLCCEATYGRGFYPDTADIFKAFELTSLDDVKVVILGQDPYYDGKATGLAFAVKADKPRGSLATIFKRVEADWGPPATTPDLHHWAVDEHVLLLNTVLTVAQDQAGSHRGCGWDRFTDQALALVKRDGRHTVVLAWGQDAVQKVNAAGFDSKRVLRASHPRATRSKGLPLFSSCCHFSEANRLLQRTRCTPICW